MLEGYHILTLTHRHTSLETIGRAVVRSDEQHDPSTTLRRLKEHFGWSELLYFATCNRVMYLFYDSPAHAAGTSNFKLQTSNLKLQTSLLSIVRPEFSDHDITASRNARKIVIQMALTIKSTKTKRSKRSLQPFPSHRLNNEYHSHQFYRHQQPNRSATH